MDICFSRTIVSFFLDNFSVSWHTLSRYFQTCSGIYVLHEVIAPRGPVPVGHRARGLHSRVPAAALYTPTAIFTAGNLHFLNLFSFFCRSAPQSPSRLVYQFVLWSVSLFLSRFFWFLDSSCKWNRMVFIFLWFISLSIILSRSMLPIAGFVLLMAD